MGTEGLRLVCPSIVVSARAVPWSTSSSGRGGRRFKCARLEEFQAIVREESVLAMAGIQLFAGPFMFCARFYFVATKGHEPGDWMTERPDVDNLSKSAKDAMKGIVFNDDCPAVREDTGKLYDTHDYCVFAVYALPRRSPDDDR